MTSTLGTCQIRDCQRDATVTVTFGEFTNHPGACLCDPHKPTVEQALRRGIVAKIWTVDGYYPGEIAYQLSCMTGHTIRESTVLADLRWLGLTEKDRAGKNRLDLGVQLGELDGTNVVALRRAQ
jgi:hypothetical protein